MYINDAGRGARGAVAREAAADLRYNIYIILYHIISYHIKTQVVVELTGPSPERRLRIYDIIHIILYYIILYHIKLCLNAAGG